MSDRRFVLDLIDAVFLASVRSNRPRAIDRYIDDFGGAAATARSAGVMVPASRSITWYRRGPAGKESLVRRQAVVLALAVMLVTLSVVADVWAGPPGDQIRLQIDRVVRVLADPALKGPGRERERQAAVRKIAEEIFDVGEMTRRTLGQHWQRRTEPERAEMITLFSDLLEHVYFTRIANYNGEKITVLKDSVEGNQATVRTRIVTPQGTEIPVDYRMLRRGDRWVAYDVVIEGVSLVANYRAQFNKVIQTSSYQALVEKLRAKAS